MAQKKKPSRFQKILTNVLRYIIASVSFAVVLYVLFALFFSTDEESKLQRENRLYRQRYARMTQQTQLIGDVVQGLMEKDNGIYEGLFKTSVPTADLVTATGLTPLADSLSESFYVHSAASTSETLMLMAGSVEANFEEVFRILRERRDSVPPLSLPLHGMSYVQTGASVGMKFNPVYKLPVQHDGLDLVAPQGAPVYAVADGTVSQVERSRKGLGNTVEIDHGNGYVTRYCLMGDITVVRGRRVKRDQQIGTVGISPTLPAPHLHFEVLRRGKPVDPVNYFFASLSPEEYARMMYLSVNTEQSMD
jgi:murein DD-endopeptidase MepM/ murein hydrolase activator NlpD